MNKYLCIALALSSSNLMAQQALQPDGGGAYMPEPTECVTKSEYARINNMLTANKDSLIRLGILPRIAADQDGGHHTLAGSLIWPVIKKQGLPHNSVYGISNFVDRNSAFPNQLQDWNCGTRTYDLSSGYNHAGVDIFTWPFGQQMQANDQAEIVAAIGGVIIGKDDGYADNSCAMSGAQWNAVYIQGSDGYTYWYGHMKKNSLTSKAIGQTVIQGEKIGIVGSSGNSTGPHLHFEIYDASSSLVDPYHGPCNSGTSLWQDQLPYYNPTININMTHSAAPVMPACPQLETINAKNYFSTNDPIVYASYLHDQTDIPVLYEVLKPDLTVYETWTQQLNPGQFYSASWWYWTNTINPNMVDGEWTFRVTFDGKARNHKFYVNVDSNGTSIKNLNNKINPLEIYPAPGKDAFTITGLKSSSYDILLTDLMGTVVFRKNIATKNEAIDLNLKLASGYYMVQAVDTKGKRHTGKLIVSK